MNTIPPEVLAVIHDALDYIEDAPLKPEREVIAARLRKVLEENGLLNDEKQGG